MRPRLRDATILVPGAARPKARWYDPRMSTDEVLALALALPVEERAKVVARLLETIEATPTEAEVEAWRARFDALPARWREHLDAEARAKLPPP